MLTAGQAPIFFDNGCDAPKAVRYAPTKAIALAVPASFFQMKNAPVPAAANTTAASGRFLVMRPVAYPPVNPVTAMAVEAKRDKETSRKRQQYAAVNRIALTCDHPQKLVHGRSGNSGNALGIERMREIDDRNASGANMIVDLNGAWARLWESQPVDLVSGQWTILLVLVLGLVLPRPVWRITGMYSTLVHELGHLISALFTGRFVTGLRLGWDHSGEVVSRGRGKVSIIISGIFGYPAPLLVSAALLWATAAGYAGRALGIYALFFVLALVFVRNWPAFVVCSASALVALGVVFFAPSSAYIYLALLLGGFLLCSGIRDYLKVLAVHTWRRRDIEQSDAYLIARATGTFATLWLLVIMALGGAGIFLGVQSLLRLF